MIMKQKSTLKGKKSGGLKVRKPLGQINANVGTTLKHNHSKNSGIKKQQKTFRKPLGTISKNSDGTKTMKLNDAFSIFQKTPKT